MSVSVCHQKKGSTTTHTFLEKKMGNGNQATLIMAGVVLFSISLGLVMLITDRTMSRAERIMVSIAVLYLITCLIPT